MAGFFVFGDQHMNRPPADCSEQQPTRMRLILPDSAIDSPPCDHRQHIVHANGTFEHPSYGMAAKDHPLTDHPYRIPIQSPPRRPLSAAPTRPGRRKLNNLRRVPLPPEQKVGRSNRPGRTTIPIPHALPTIYTETDRKS